MKIFLQELISSFLKNKGLDIKPEINEITNHDYGDFSSNVLFRIQKNNPQLANDLLDYLKNNKETFENVEIVKGFLNMKLKVNFAKHNVTKNLDLYHSKNINKIFNINTQNINFEFISANPTGYLHIGHARNAIVGDVIINLLEIVGNKVKREFYVNDAGNQINDLLNSIKIHANLIQGEPPYKGQDVKKAAEILVKENKDFVNFSDSKIKEFATNYFLNEIKRIILELNIKPFDKFSSEKDLYNKNLDKTIIDKLIETNNAELKDGAIWLKTSQEKYKDDKDRVIKKSTGENTYFLMDIVYHAQKANEGFDKLIDLWGTDHKGHEKKLFIALEMLGYKSNLVEVCFINMVQIMDGEDIVKMSKRLGTSLTIKDMLGIIDVNQLRYFLLSKRKETEIDIDVKLVNTKDNSNPYHYVQYAYVRAKNILNKLKDSNISINLKGNFEKVGNEPSERQLLLHLTKFWDYVLMASNEREPNIIIEYWKNLSSFFHSFYNYCVVINDDPILTKERGQLVLMTQSIFNIIYSILGIKPLEEM